MRLKRNGSRKKGGRFKGLISLGLVVVMVVQALVITGTSQQVVASSTPNGGLKSVLVRYRGEPATGDDAVDKVAELERREKWLAGSLKFQPGYKKIVQTYSQLPLVLMAVDEEGEAALKQDPNILGVAQNEILEPLDLPFATTPGVVGGDWQTGFSDGSGAYTGDGIAVAVIDSGVDNTHPNLSGVVVSEACFGENQEYIDAIIESVCPGHAEVSTASGAAAPCQGSGGACTHGTSVASMIAMQPTEGMTLEDDLIEASGVAKDAKIIAIQINMKIIEKSGQPDICGDSGNQTEECYRPSLGTITAALNRVLALHNDSSFTLPIAAVNMSIGTTGFFTDDAAACQSFDSYGVSTAVAALRNVNIATIAAAGNDGDNPANTGKISYPACLSNVVAVSASTADGHMASYSNAGSLTNLVAPGGEVDPGAAHSDGGLFAAIPGATLQDQFDATQGTSFSAPIVAGTWALLREKAPDASVSGILGGLQDSGVTIADDRLGYEAFSYAGFNIGATLAVADSLPLHTLAGSNDDSSSPGGGSPDSSWIPGAPMTGAAGRSWRAIGVFLIAGAALIVLHSRFIRRLALRV